MNVRRLLFLMVLPTVFFCEDDASAQDEPVPPAVAPAPAPAPAPEVVPLPPATSADAHDLARLDELLKDYVSKSRGYRLAGGLSAIAIGGAAVTGGVVALDREDSAVGFFAVAAGAGAVLGGTLLLVAPFGPLNKMEKLSDLVDAGRSAGKHPTLVLREVESEWRDAAEKSRGLRRTFGIIGVVIGGVAVAGGTAFLVADSFGSASRKEMDGFGGALLGLGYLSVLTGFQAFFFEEPIEAGWRAYQTGRPPRTTGVAPSRPRLGFSPTLGGGAAVLSASF